MRVVKARQLSDFYVSDIFCSACWQSPIPSRTVFSIATLFLLLAFGFLIVGRRDLM